MTWVSKSSYIPVKKRKKIEFHQWFVCSNSTKFYEEKSTVAHARADEINKHFKRMPFVFIRLEQRCFVFLVWSIDSLSLSLEYIDDRCFVRATLSHCEKWNGKNSANRNQYQCQGYSSCCPVTVYKLSGPLMAFSYVNSYTAKISLLGDKWFNWTAKYFRGNFPRTSSANILRMSHI